METEFEQEKNVPFVYEIWRFRAKALILLHPSVQSSVILFVMMSVVSLGIITQETSNLLIWGGKPVRDGNCGIFTE